MSPRDSDQIVEGSSIICDGTIMFSLSRLTSPYLYPCLVQYCVICAGVLLAMWTNVSYEHQHVGSRAEADKMCGEYVNNSCQRYNVDCNGSHAGLFCGVVMVVLTIVSLILNFVLTTKEVSRSSMVRSMSDLVIYTVATVAVLIGTCQMRYTYIHRRLYCICKKSMF